MSDDARAPHELKLEVPGDVAPGKYANLAVISHSATEFVLDFAARYAGQPALVTARIVTSPRHAKRLLAALAENVRRYEAAFGTIDEDAPAPAASSTRTQTN